MVQFVIDVVIDPTQASRGTRKVKGDLKETETAADRLGRTLKRAFAFTAIAGGVVQLGRLADQFTNAQNRLRTLVDGEEQLTEVTERLFEISNRTRQSFAATASVYSRVGLAAKDLGLEQEELLQFTESLNQAVALSGASATEAEAGLTQLSQGLAAGALRGEELNSVLEQLPVVADVIAKSLGVTRGQLRALGAEGKISAEVVTGAFAEARVELEDRFGKAVPTIGQSFTVLNNNILEAVGSLDEATGASAAFSSLLLFAADNLDLVAGGVLTLSAGIAVSYIPATVTATAATNALGASLARISAALLANPFGIAVAALTAAGVAAAKFAGELEEIENQILKTTEAGEKFALTEFGKVGADIQKTSERLKVLTDLATKDLAAGKEVYVGLATEIERTEQKLAKLTEQQGLVASGAAKTTVEALEQQKAIEALAGSVEELITGIGRENQLLKENATERKIQKTLLSEIAALEKGDGPKVTDEDRQRLELEVRRNDELTRQADVLEGIRGPARAFQETLQALTALEQTGAITAEEFSKALEDLGRSAAGVDLSALGGGDSGEALAAIKARLEASRELARTEAERVRVLEEIQGPLQGLTEKEAILFQLQREGLITEEQLGTALAANAEAIRLLNPEYSRLAELTEQILGPTRELEQRQADLQTLIAQGGDATGAYAAELERVNEQLNPLTEAQQRELELLEELQGPRQTQLEQIAALNALFEAGRISSAEYAKGLEKIGVAAETSNTASEGFRIGLRNAQSQFTDVQGAAQSLAEDGFGAAEDALVSLATKGEADFGAFVDSLLEDITRLLIKQALLAAFGGPGAAGAGFLGSLFGGGRQGGGDVNPNQAFLVGEDGPELFTPPGAGEIIPAGQTAALAQGAQAAAPIVEVGGPTINNVVVDDPEAIPSGIESPEGTQAVLNVIRKERRTVKGTIG